jgi:Putative zinc-finger
MSCNKIQQSLSLYVDDGLTKPEREACYRHLEVCPVCRARLAEIRSLRSSLALLSRPAPPSDLVSSINLAVVAQAAADRARRNASTLDVINDWALRWLQPRLMRYSFSSFASLIIFAAVFAALRPHMVALHEASVAFEQMQLTNVSVGSPDYGFDINQPISPENYAALRTPFNAESPSLNPRSALAMLAREEGSWPLNKEGDDDLVVVADVFTNGSASLANVMHSPRDHRMLADFAEALQKDAAFVPAALDRRPQTMRVVFSVQRVNVRDRQY